MIVIDIESKPIVDYAPLLPCPVGVAVIWPDGTDEYLAFGHPTGNNTTWDNVKEKLERVWASDEEILTHNGATFDIPALEHFFGLPKINPMRVHDTLFLAYLHNPHAKSLSLKDLAESWLGMPNDSQRELQDWIMINTDCRSRKKSGAYICEAPGELVGKYAIDDVLMTKALYDYIAPVVLPSMQEAYDRERALGPILAEVQNVGVRCDVERLRADFVTATSQLHSLDSRIREILKAPTLEIDKDAQLVEALQTAGYSNFLTTPTGRVATNKDSLKLALEAAPELSALLKQRAAYATLTGTFMSAWLEAADANGGRIHAAYNQVRNPEGYGTRTGRLSSSKPNFQNVPGDLGEGMPKMRSYLMPEEGHVWVTGDFKSQEPRIAAHFEDGALCQAFRDDPDLDQYLWIAELCGVTRKEAKVVLLGLLYAMGAATLAERLGCDSLEATRLRNIIKATLPDIVALDIDCKRRFSLGLPIRTLGGRLYNCEAPANGRSWEYKALNVLVQGSAADMTKQAIVYLYDKLEDGERILGTVHDEISISCKPERVAAIVELLGQAASSLACDVPMLMDCGSGANWAEAK